MTIIEEPTATTLDERLFQASIGALELFGVYLGDRLGLYEAIRTHGPVTVSELATTAGIDPRYAQEWLEQQAVAGFLTCVNADVTENERRFELPAEHVGALVDPEHEAYTAPFAHMMVGIARVLDDVATAYRTGGGVPYSRYGAAFRHGQGAINRPAFSSALVDEWLPAVGGLGDRLDAGARIADIGCGQGWSTMAIADRHPEAEVWGVDPDVASIDDARRFAAERDVDVRFEAVDAAELATHGPFDAVLILEALHDMARPVEVLQAARTALGDDGSVIVADEAVAESFASPGDDIERMMYGWSIVHCLPASMAEQPSAAIGTVIRESTVRQLAHAAGFRSVQVVPVDAGFFRLYELKP
jgi:2-polyprenyl-3-methyl-5-hydroxy-6-metoxy-1,4-benzoquinol methylase